MKSMHDEGILTNKVAKLWNESLEDSHEEINKLIKRNESMNSVFLPSPKKTNLHWECIEDFSLDVFLWT